MRLCVRVGVTPIAVFGRSTPVCSGNLTCNSFTSFVFLSVQISFPPRHHGRVTHYVHAMKLSLSSKSELHAFYPLFPITICLLPCAPSQVWRLNDRVIFKTRPTKMYWFEIHVSSKVELPTLETDYITVAITMLHKYRVARLIPTPSTPVSNHFWEHFQPLNIQLLSYNCRQVIIIYNNYVMSQSIIVPGNATTT